MERSKRSFNVRMKHEDDHGMNGDSNLSQTVCVHLNKENSQGTMTLTDNKKRETTKMKDLQCMKTHPLASTTLTLTCSPSLSGHFTHCLGFALCFVSSMSILVAVTIYSILTCTRIPCRDSHCENGSCEVLSLHSPSVAVERRQQ